MSDDKLIGRGACPICGSVKARFTFSKKNLACITCDGCQFQGFARSDNSDTRLRAMVKPAAPAEPPPPAPAAAPAAAPAPAPEPVKTETKKSGPSWGILGAFNG